MRFRIGSHFCGCAGTGRLASLRCLCPYGRAGSTPASRTTSPRTTYRSRRLFCKSHLSLILSRLLSKPDPLALGSGFVLGADPVAYIPSSVQSPLCSDVFLCLRQKRRHPPAPLLLLSKPDPLALGSGFVLGADPVAYIPLSVQSPLCADVFSFRLGGG